MPVTAAEVKSLARDQGFDLCGITRAEAFPELQHLREWLARRFEGDMTWIARTVNVRCDPQRILPGARSVIALGTLYNTRRPYSTEIADPRRALVSRYAWGDDYHVVIERRMESLVQVMRERCGDTPLEACPYVDTGPVQERVFAQRAGLGWVGKNGCLINAEQGSWFFLSVILTTLELDTDNPALDQCGACTLCLEACPTQAFVAPGVLDARRCLSYLTIEQKREIPTEFHDAMGAHVYGCDICQDVCPYNHDAPVSDDPAWQPRPVFDNPRLDALDAASDDDLRAAMRESAMERAGVSGLRRNLAVALARRGESRRS